MENSMRSVVVALVATGVFAAPALAFQAGAPDEAPAAESKKERMICKTTEQIGSRLKKSKSCRTAREWADLKQQTQQKMVEMQRVGVKSQ